MIISSSVIRINTCIPECYSNSYYASGRKYEHTQWYGSVSSFTAPDVDNYLIISIGETYNYGSAVGYGSISRLSNGDIKLIFQKAYAWEPASPSGFSVSIWSVVNGSKASISCVGSNYTINYNYLVLY